MKNIKKIKEHTFGGSAFMRLEIDGKTYEITCYFREDGEFYKTSADDTPEREKIIAAFKELY